jgi:hypothetical protein
VSWPLRRDMQCELARLMLSVGAAATAFDLFVAVDQWEQAADCLIVCGKEARVRGCNEAPCREGSSRAPDCRPGSLWSRSLPSVARRACCACWAT